MSGQGVVLLRLCRWSAVAVAAWLSVASVAPADELAAPGDPQPVLRLAAGGPLSNIYQLDFSPDGKSLYAVGQDKVVHTWKSVPSGEGSAGGFVYRPDLVLRVPIGPGAWGVLNALAVADDKIAVGGAGVSTAVASFHEKAIVFPTEVFSAAQAQEEGLIYVFDAVHSDRTVLLRGHRGPVLAMAFVKVGEQLRLVSAAHEPAGEGKPGGRSVESNVNDSWLVFRVWDVDAKKEVARFRPPERSRFATWAPRDLAAWNENGSLKIAYCAWDETLGPGERSQRLRLFDLTTGQAVRLPLAVVPGRCCRWDPQSQQLFFGAQTEPAGLWRWDKSKLDRLWTAPPGQAIVTVQPMNGKRVAMVVRENKNFACRLVIVENSVSQNAPNILNDSPIGPWLSPRLAATKVGVLAACVNRRERSPQILVGPLESTQTGVAWKQEPLGAAGHAVSKLHFVRKNNRIGVALLENDGRSGVVMDLSNGHLDQTAEQLAGWQPWSAEESRLQFVLSDKTHPNAKVTGPDGQTVELSYFPRKIVQGSQLVVRGPKLSLPGLPDISILAVASDPTNAGEPELDLYDANAGRRLRRLSGHSAEITGLSFSADGRLLASCARDCTVNVWWLPDLVDTIDKHGGLPPTVTVRQVEEVIQVTEVGKAGPDRLVGLIESNQPQPREFSSAFDLLGRLWELPRGAKVALDVLRGDRPVRIPLVLEQGVDQRNPLFSLFMIQDDPEHWSWAAWNPRGPFETSDKAIERYVGWHRNTNKSDKPAAFAAIGQYRKDFFGRGLLRALIEEGPDIRWPPRLPEPRASLEIIEPGNSLLEPEKRPGVVEFDPADQHWIVRDNALPLCVHVTVEGQDAVEVVTGVDVELMNAAGQPVNKVSLDWDEVGMRWTKPLSRLIAEPADARMQAVVHMAYAGRSQDSKPIALPPVRFQHRAPRLAEPLLSNVQVQQAAYRFVARLDAAVPATAAIVHESSAGKRSFSIPVSHAQPIAQQLDLARGLNTIRLRVKNNDPLDGHEASETLEQAISVNFDPGRPPEIAFGQLSDSDNRIVVPAPSGQYLVNAPEPVVRLVGRITSQQRLGQTVWECFANNQPTGKHGRFEARGDKGEFDFSVDLIPGSQEIRLTAPSVAGVGFQTLRVDYRPPLPQIVGIKARRSVFVVVNKAETSLAVTLDEPPHVYHYDATLKVDGRRVEIAAVADVRDEPRRRTLTWIAPLALGANRIGIVVDNGFERYQSQPVSVEVKAIPDAIQLLGDPIVLPNSSAVQLAVAIASRVEPQVEINQSPRPVFQAKFERAGENRWKSNMTIRGLAPGSHRLELWATTPDGKSERSTMASVDLPAPPPQHPRPVVTIVEPASGATFPQGVVKLRYTVKPQSLWQQARIFVDGIPTRGEQRRDAEGAVDLRLATGKRDIRVEVTDAVNQVAYAETSVSVVPSPTSLEIERLTWIEGAQQGMASPRAGHEFDRSVPTARVKVHGRVKWGDRDDAKRHDGKMYVRLWVNAFLQKPVEIPAPAADAMTSLFDAEVVLNRSEGNVIAVELYGPPNEGSPEYWVDCDNPERNQSLYFLVVSPHEKDVQLRDQLYRAFNVQDPSKVVLKECVGSQSELMHINRALVNLKTASRASNCIVLFYYRGRESRFEGSDDSFQLETGPLDSEYLEQVFRKLLGAHLLFMDIEGESGKPRSKQWKSAPPMLGVVRCANLQPPGSTLAEYLAKSRKIANNKNITLLDLSQLLKSGKPGAISVSGRSLSLPSSTR